MTVPDTAASPIATGAAPLRFFLLVLLMSVPFYILGATGLRLPGLTILPASALMTFTPMIAALILVQSERGAAAAIAMFKRVLRPSPDHRIRWPLTALLFMPVVCLLEFGVLRLTGSAVPLPQIAPGAALLLFAGFMIGAIGEEVGWQGYAYPALRTRLSVLASSAVLGSIWALWHIVPFFQLGRSLEWIFWHSLSAVALRVIIVWLFENTGGSILIAVLFHTMINLSWALFPVAGSYYNPLVTFVILAIAVGAITSLWRRNTLSSFGLPAPSSPGG